MGNNIHEQTQHRPCDATSKPGKCCGLRQENATGTSAQPSWANSPGPASLVDAAQLLPDLGALVRPPQVRSASRLRLLVVRPAASVHLSVPGARQGCVLLLQEALGPLVLARGRGHHRPTRTCTRATLCTQQHGFSALHRRQHGSATSGRPRTVLTGRRRSCPHVLWHGKGRDVVVRLANGGNVEVVLSTSTGLRPIETRAIWLLIKFKTLTIGTAFSDSSRHCMVVRPPPCRRWQRTACWRCACVCHSASGPGEPLSALASHFRR